MTTIVFTHLIRKLLTGLSIPQQYICLAKETVECPMQVSLQDYEMEVNVTDSHIFLGYKPLIIALKFSGIVTNDLTSRESIRLNFHSIENAGVATLKLKRIASRRISNFDIVFYEGVDGKHKFISTRHQLINSVREKFRKNAPGNISLAGKLHDMVRIAYSVARPIHLITLLEGEKMNMFPTDLHGPVAKDYYVSSLRKNGKANEQVERVGTIVLSRVAASAFQDVYALGRNHMNELRPTSDFKSAPESSRILGYPIPAFALDYIELKRVESFDIGNVHRIHVYEILGRENLRSGLTLAHVHQYYAQWRLDNKLNTEMLLR
jgi:flavin reductase (DIM6/NTAB) family NADH-FMN oxidoreductase RutF